MYPIYIQLVFVIGIRSVYSDFFFFFTAAGMDKMEVKNQQIQTEIVKTVEQHVQAGSNAKQQGVYTTFLDEIAY